MSDAVSPVARRLATPRWLDARLVLGVVLVLFAVVAGARVFASADHFSAVYVAKHDLVPGERLTAADVAVGHVRLAGLGHLYIAAGALPDGYVVDRYVSANEIVPVAALSPGALPANTRLVTVPVVAGHLPPGLGRGSLVDVYMTPKSGGGAATSSAPVLVLAGAAVDARDSGSRAFGGESTLSVVLSVPVERVADLVRAVESGNIDLVAVPAASAAGTGG